MTFKEIIIYCFILPAVTLFLGLWIGLNNGKGVPKKHYPIEVQCHWSTDGWQSYPTMECDSIKGDTLWKDGTSIVCKNIIQISFK
jgi:hypothetical protein